MRTLAIDLGTRRIGLALSDAGGRFATPHEVLFVTAPGQATEPILKLIASEEVGRLVVGLPLNMDGSTGAAAVTTANWAWAIHCEAARIRPGLELVFVDERLSSFDAEQRLIDRKRSGERITRKQKKQSLDAIVAAALLQEYLDGRLPALELEGDQATPPS